MALFTLVKGLPVLAACVLAADYPTVPADKTTPVQQRIAINGPNGKSLLDLYSYSYSYSSISLFILQLYIVSFACRCFFATG
jgi:hypothetical protein